MGAPSKVAMRSLLRTKGHIGKEAAKFQFDVTVERLVGLQTGPHSLKWTRGAKVAYTKPFQIEKKTVGELEIGQRISLLCTLYRSKTSPDNAPYDAKDSKFSLISLKDGKKNEKTIGKVHFNIAEYAGVPSSEATVKFKLSNKTTVEVTITCTFIQIANGSGSSVGSVTGRTSISSGEPEADPDEDTNFNDVVADDDAGLETAEDDELFSPVTPAGNQSFAAAKNFFEARGEGQLTAAGKSNENMQPVISKVSSSSREKENFGQGLGRVYEERKNTGRTQGEESARALTNRKSSASTQRGGPKHSTEAKKDLAKTRSELERMRDMAHISEDTIKSLRAALSKKEAEIKDLKAQHGRIMKEKVNELNREIEDIESRSQKRAANYEEQLNSLREEAERVEKSKSRLQDELVCMRDELRHSKRVPSKAVGSTSGESTLSGTELQHEVESKRDLEKKCQRLKSEVDSLKVRIKAHEEDSQAVQKKHDDLCKTYSQLREQHASLQKELQRVQNTNPANGNKSASGKANRFDKQNLWTARTERRRDSQSDTESCDNDAVRAALSDASQSTSNLQDSTAGADVRIANLAIELNRTKAQLEESELQSSEQANMYGKMRTKYEQVRQKLGESEKRCGDLRRRIHELEAEEANEPEDDLIVEDLEFRCSSELREKISKAFRFSAKARYTIRKLKEDLREAYEREDAFERDVLRMKEEVDKLTEKAKMRLREDASKIEMLEKELEKRTASRDSAHSAIEEMHEKEQSYKSKIESLQRAIAHLEESSATAKDTNMSTLGALRGELKMKQEEVRTLSETMESLRRELHTKKEVSETLSSRIKELELENEIIKKQARHEVQLAKEASLQVESSYEDQSRQAAQHREEIRSLKLVAETLREEVREHEMKATAEAMKASKQAKENKKLRDEAALAERNLEGQIGNQKAVIESLRSKLQEAADTNRQVSEDAAVEAAKILQLAEDKQKVERKIQAAQNKCKEQEEELVELRSRIEELTSEIEETNRRDQASIDRVTRKLRANEKELEEALDKEEELKRQLDQQADSFSDAQRNLKRTLAKNEQLLSQHDRDEESRSDISAQLSHAEKELESRQQAVEDLQKRNNDLSDDLASMKAEVTHLQESVGNLRSELSDAQSKHAAILATSAADMSRTRSELEEVKEREAHYEQDVTTKSQLIDELTTKLTNAVGKSAADAARADAELSEALSREQALKEETKILNEKLSGLETDFTVLRNSTAEAQADTEAELTEALSREETYQLEVDRLQKSIEELQKKLDKATNSVKRLEEEKKGKEILSEVEGKTAAGMRANKAMAEVLGLTGDSSLSSSNIRKLDMFEKITDERLLDMLVETKMQLALAEEEKLQLEHLIRRVCDGDKETQDKVAQQAERLEIKLTRASEMIDSMQADDLSRTQRKGSIRLPKEKQVMEGSQLQFFRRPSAEQPSIKSAKSQSGKKKSKSRRHEAPQDEWDLGDDSPSGGHSDSRSFSARSSSTD